MQRPKHENKQEGTKLTPQEIDKDPVFSIVKILYGEKAASLQDVLKSQGVNFPLFKVFLAEFIGKYQALEEKQVLQTEIMQILEKQNQDLLENTRKMFSTMQESEKQAQQKKFDDMWTREEILKENEQLRQKLQEQKGTTDKPKNTDGKIEPPKQSDAALVKQIEQLREENSGLRAEIDDQRDELRIFQESQKKLEEKNRKLQAENNDLREEQAEKQEEINMQDEIHAAEKAKLLEEIDKLKKELRKAQAELKAVASSPISITSDSSAQSPASPETPGPAAPAFPLPNLFRSTEIPAQQSEASQPKTALTKGSKKIDPSS